MTTKMVFVQNDSCLAALEKLAEAPIGVFDDIFSRAVRVFRDAALRVGVGLMVCNGQDGGEKRLVGLIGPAQRAEFPDGTGVNVLVAHAPDVHECRVGKIFLVNDAVIAVGDKERFHVVEGGVAAVEEHRVVTFALEHAGDGLHIFGTVAVDNGVPGQRRERRQRAFHAAHGAVAGGVDVVEQQAFLRREPVHFRCQRVGASEAAPEFRPEAFFQQNHDVEARAVRVTCDLPGDVVGTAGEGGVGGREHPVQAGVGFVAGNGFVKGVVVEVARPGGREKGNRAVVGDFVDGAVFANVRRIQIDRPGQAEKQNQRAGEPEKPSAHPDGFGPHRAEQPSGEPHPPGADEQATGDHRRHRVGVPDVDEDLARIDEVIHRDGIEARLEFLEKEKFRRQQKDLNRPEQSHEKPEPKPVDE